MKSKITLKDIAKELGVSISTVSKSLNDSYEISIETKNKVKAFADYYNYKPNSLALKLKKQKSYLIGVIIPEIVHHFFSSVLRGIEEFANSKGYNIMFCISNESYKKEKLNTKMLLEGGVEGILISVSSKTQRNNNYQHLQELIDDKFPIVLFDRAVEEIKCDKVIINDEGGAYKATNHLIESGCKNIVLITHPDYVGISNLRKKGYTRALSKHNIPIKDELIIEINSEKKIKKKLEKLLKAKNNTPDGILAANGEIYASTAMQIAKKNGFKIPKDISIITFTNGVISKHSSPPLTTLVQHGFEMGKQAVELLINRIEKKDLNSEFQRKVISTNLKIRKSTKKTNKQKTL